LFKEAFLHRLELYLLLLDFLVELSNISEEFIGLRGDEIKAVEELVIRGHERR
jgi:hypothetical protein